MLASTLVSGKSRLIGTDRNLAHSVQKAHGYLCAVEPFVSSKEMQSNRTPTFREGAALLLFSAVLLIYIPAWAVPLQGSAPASAKVVGTIQSLSGNKLVVKSDEGDNRNIAVQDATHYLQVNPGEKDLKKSVPIHLQDLQTGDRVLVLGKDEQDKSVTAGYVIVMKKIDLEARQSQQQQDWQKRGIGGLVSAVDPASGDITIALTSLGGKKVVTLHTTKTTIVRRYAPNSVKFDDAKPSTLAEIKPGDQLRARGNRNEDGTEFTAEEIVSGSFRNIAGTISAIDAASGTMTVADSISKNPVQVKVTPESQMRKLPVPMAQRIAMRLKGAGGTGGPAGTPGGGGAKPTESASAGSGATNGGGEGGAARAAGGDLQQMLSRLPASGLSDFQKGDAVMIVSTEGVEGDAVTAITVVGGVEPILTSAPKGVKDMVISPWSLSAGEGGG